MLQSNKEIKSVMFDIKKRELTVKRIQMLTPKIKIVTLSADSLVDFKSLSPDDHIKVFIPTNSGPVMRDYTPLRFDQKNLELDLAFYLHGQGPGSQWGIKAQVGDKLVIGGPKGSRIVPYAFDWYLMLADETGIPSVLRRLAEMPQEAKAEVFLEVSDKSCVIKQEFSSNVKVHWIYRDSSSKTQAENFIEEISKSNLPSGEGFTWIALENRATKVVSLFLQEKFNLPSDWIKARGYWIQ